MSCADLDWSDQHGRNPPRRPTDMTLFERAECIRILERIASNVVLRETREGLEVRKLLARIGVQA